MLILHKSVHLKNKNLKEIIEITHYYTLDWKYVTDNKIFFNYENFMGSCTGHMHSTRQHGRRVE